MLPGLDMNSWVVPALLLILAGLLLVLVRAWRQNRHLLQVRWAHAGPDGQHPDLTWVKDTQSRFIFVTAVRKNLRPQSPIAGRSHRPITSLLGMRPPVISPTIGACCKAAGALLREGPSQARGRETWAETLKVPLFDRRKVIGTTGGGICRTQACRTDAAAWRRHDYLTNLANRPALAASFESILRAQPAHQCVALFFIDLDNFKDLNDAGSRGG